MKNGPERRAGARAADSITWRIFAGTAVIVGLVVVAALIMASSAARRTAESSARRSLEQAADLVAQLLAGRERSLAGGARVFVQAPYFRTLVAEHRRDDILDQTFEAAEQLQAAWVFITDGAGTLLAKSDEPSAYGDALGQVGLIANAIRGQMSGGFGVSGDSLLFQVSAVPIALPHGTPFGVLVATRIVDSALAADIRLATASEIVFYATDRAGAPHIVATTLPPSSATRISVLQALEPSSSSGAANNLRASRHDVRIDGEKWIMQSAALSTAGGNIVGGFAVLRLQDAALATLAGVRRSLVIAGALGFLLALCAAWVAARSITRPIRSLVTAVRRAADGDYGAPALTALSAISSTERAGEIGVLARAFDELLIDLRDRDSLSATTAAVVSLEHAAIDARLADAALVDAHVGRRRQNDGTLVFSSATASPIPTFQVQRGHVLANRYRIDAMLGSGGMGMVYRAHDRVLGELVAVKVLRPELLPALAATDTDAREHLRDEVRLTRRITHRNVVRIHDIGDSEGIPFLTMELVEGASLFTVIRVGGPLPVTTVLSLARQLMRALSAAHDVGIVHGDIKPSNILVGPNGVLKVTDFGIARVVRGAQRLRRVPTSPDDEVSGRVGGATIGTPEYLAPELLIGGSPSIASDLYAAGVVLHECLVGTTPYTSDTPMGFLASKFESSTDSPWRSSAAQASRERAARGIPDLLETILEQLTHPDPDERPASASQVRDRLDRFG